MTVALSHRQRGASLSDWLLEEFVKRDAYQRAEEELSRAKEEREENE